MPQNGWQRRIERADELAHKHAFAAEILRFYSMIARFQGALFGRLSKEPAELLEDKEPGMGGLLAPAVQAQFPDFLDLLQNRAPGKVAERARDLGSGAADFRQELLSNFWRGIHPQRQEIDEFIARAFLQPYAEFVRSRLKPAQEKHTSTLCSFCGRRPGVGVLRSLGEGGQRSLVCSFCLAEWPFRRILCPGCGEEDHRRLPVFTAAELEHVRVEVCDSCKTYIKTVDLTRNGLAEPVVDEIAAVPLDLWAQERGYAKLQPNLMQM
jgi:formate dehydrogenase accessory protein FdhE